jgi:hypothetical protein
LSVGELPDPDDDAFVTTAIQGLRVPSHKPDFWDQLAWRLDDAADELVSEGLLQAVMPRSRSVTPRHAAPAAPPEPVDIDAPADAWVEADRDPYGPIVGPIDDPFAAPPEEPATVAVARVAPIAAPHEPRRTPLRSGTARVLVDAPTAATPGPARMAEPVIHHDPAVLPATLRRTSNALLVALAVAAAVVAVMAGLTLVKQRNDASAPTPSEVAPDDADRGREGL